MNGEQPGSGEEVTAPGLKLIPDTSAPHSTTWVTPLCQEPATGGAGFLGNLSKCFLICPRLRSLLVWAASPSGCDHLLPDKLFFHLSGRPALPHLHKMNNQHFEETFFLSFFFFLLVKWVYYEFIFHCLSNRCCQLSEEFSVLPSLSRWVDCQMLGYTAELRVHAREVSGSTSAMGKGTKVLLSLVGQGDGCCFKMEKCKQAWNRCRRVLTAVEAAWCSRESIGFGTRFGPELKSQRYHFQSSVSWTLCCFFKV